MGVRGTAFDHEFETNAMTDPKDKDRVNPPTNLGRPAITNKDKDNEGRPAGGKDPDLYDPVGMAGKKAGIVKELGQEACDPAEPEKEDAAPNSKDQTLGESPAQKDKP